MSRDKLPLVGHDKPRLAQAPSSATPDCGLRATSTAVEGMTAVYCQFFTTFVANEANWVKKCYLDALLIKIIIKEKTKIKINYHNPRFINHLICMLNIKGKMIVDDFTGCLPGSEDFNSIIFTIWNKCHYVSCSLAVDVCGWRSTGASASSL